jgi:hypothetical protein
MNHSSTYEALIAGKLEQLPVPDMADAIWARIEQQLDVDMPVNDQTPPSGGNAGLRFPGTIFSVFLIALVSVVLLWKKNNISVQVPSPQRYTQPERIQSVGVVDSIIPIHRIAPKNDPIVLPVSAVKQSDSSAILPAEVNNETVVPVVSSLPEKISKVESQSIPEINKTIPAPAVDSVAKKQRGVKGIPSNGYKIAPVKKNSDNE